MGTTARFSVAVVVLAVAAAAIVAFAAGRTSAPTGARIFAARCASCHTFGPRHVASEGGDLSQLKLTLAQVESFTRVMPERPRLTAGEIRAVSVYLLRPRS